MQNKVILFTTAFLLAVPAVYFFFFEFQGLPLPRRLWGSLFQAVTPRTAGFNTLDLNLLSENGRLLTGLLMLVGGSPGSTAGGIKICRLIVLVKTVAAELRRTLHPQMLLSVYYSKVRLSMATVTNIGRFFFMYIFIVALLTLVTTASGVAPEEAIFGVASCLASVGPAFGSIGATGTYTELPAGAKIAMALAMLLGRLELFTALALLRS